MKDLSKETKIIKVITCLLSIIVLIVGLGFSYLVATLDDAPGFIIIGGTITLIGTMFIYGLGEIIIQLKKNNEILTDIQSKLDKK